MTTHSAHGERTGPPQPAEKPPWSPAHVFVLGLVAGVVLSSTLLLATRRDLPTPEIAELDSAPSPREPRVLEVPEPARVERVDVAAAPPAPSPAALPTTRVEIPEPQIGVSATGSAGTPAPTPEPPSPLAALAESPTTVPLPQAPAASEGGFWVQLGALPSESLAQEQSEALRKRHADLLDPFPTRILRADLGENGIHYRLRAGPFSDETVADTLCRDLEARSAQCFVVR